MSAQAPSEPAISKKSLLSDLRPGTAGRVVALSDRLQGPPRRRLLDLGLIPGTVVKAAFTSPAGNPTAYEIRGALIALRQAQAELIEIETICASALMETESFKE